MVLYLKRLLRAAIVSGLGFGGGVGLFVFIFILMAHGSSEDPAAYALKASVFVGIIFACLLIVVMVLLDLTVKLYLAKGYSENVWELEQSREVQVEGTFRQIAAACRQALLAVPDVGNVSDDAEALSAHASTGASWRSPGEELEVKINPVDNKTWRIRCVSKSKTDSVVFDYGKNFENVEVWRRELALALPKQ